MIKELTKEAVKGGVKQVLKDGFETSSVYIYAGFLCATAMTGLEIGYKGWRMVYAEAGKLIKKLPEKLKKQPKPASDGNEKPEEPKQE